MNRIILTFLGGLLIASCSAKKAQKGDLPPNVIIIFTDDMGYNDIAPFGSPVSTPNLMNMAEEGITLTDFYVSQPVCSASRASLLTGSYSNRVSVAQAFFPNQKTGLHPDEVTIAEILKEEGYRTAIFGKWHLGDQKEFLPTRQGFDEFYGIPYSHDMWPGHPQQELHNFGPLPLIEGEKVLDTVGEDLQTQMTFNLTKRAVDFIESNKDNPFFLYVAHPQPHVPLFVSEKFRGKSGHGLYGDVVQELDWSVGEILEALDIHGIEENTLVIFTSDNGPWLSYGNHGGSAAPFREGKGTTFEGGVRVPFIAKLPGVFPEGKIIETPVMTIDLLPTITKLIGGELPERPIDGKNVLEVLKGETTESPQEAYYFYYNKNELHSVRYGDWKMHFPHSYGSVAARDVGKDGFPGTSRRERIEEPELFNLEKDPEEKNNVIDKNPEIVAKINVLANQKRIKLGDALTGVEGTETRPLGKVE